MRPYLSFPRGARIPSPRVLFYASDEPELARRDLALALALAHEFKASSLVLATGSAEVTQAPPPAGVEIVKVPSVVPGVPVRPLARERVRKLRRKLLSTLFDVFMPDLLLLDMFGPEAELEAHLLLERARALGAASLVGVSHDRPGEPCFPGNLEASACDRCRARTCSSAREALEELERKRGRKSS